MGRRWVIGDVHGCSRALRGLLEAIAPGTDDEVIFLGDYIDRGSDSRDCVNQIIELRKHTRVITLRGNHELMLTSVLFGGMDDQVWLSNGGRATVASYGGNLSRIPDAHRDFFTGLLPHHETESEIFVHANYQAELSPGEFDDFDRYWKHLSFPLSPPHDSGRRVFVGHTPQANFQVLDLGHLVCVDTCCFGGGYLTALNLDDGEQHQFDLHGHPRRRGLLERWQRWRDLRSRSKGERSS